MRVWQTGNGVVGAWTDTAEKGSTDEMKWAELAGRSGAGGRGEVQD